MLSSFLRVSFTVLTLYGFLGSNNAFSQAVSQATVTAPDFRLTGQTMSGQSQEINLNDYRGQIVYIDFWASWCQPCRKSFGWMNKMQALYGKEGFKVIAINLDEEREKAEKFLKQVPASFDVAYDPQGNTAEAYRVRAMPSSYLVDKNGRVVHANLGFRGNDEGNLETIIRTLIRQSTVASR